MSRLSFLVSQFANSSSDPGQDYIAANITADLTAALSRIEGGTVIAYASAITLRPSALDIAEAARRFRVKFVLCGSAAAREKDIRIDAALINAETWQELQRETLERELIQLTALEKEIAAKIARTLEATLPDTGPPLAAIKDTEAFDALLRGKAMLHMPQTPERLAEARLFLSRALAAIPEALDAIIGLASVHLATALARSSRSPEADLLQAERLVQRALAIDPCEAQALDVLGALRRAVGKPREALAAYQAALAANPSDANACAQIVRVKLDLGEAEDAVPLIERALALSPVDPQRSLWFTFAGMALLYDSDPRRARAWLEKAVAANSRFATPLVFLAAAAELDGDGDSARLSLARARQLAPRLSIAGLEQQFAPAEPRARARWAPIAESLRRVGLLE